MEFKTEFVDIDLSQLRREASVMKTEGWRFIQTHAVLGDGGVDLYYSFMKDGLARNLKVTGVTKEDPVPSITDLFLAAFVFENEARELFGVDMRDIALDFQGGLYAPAVNEPMTIITPEQKAAREKAAKAAAAKAAAAKSDGGDASDKGSDSDGGTRRVFKMTPELQARLDAKLATMSPDKVAKVKAALAAREAEAAAATSGNSQDEKPSAPANETAPSKEAPSANAESAKADAKRDLLLEQKIAMMDPAKAAKVRAALSSGEAPVAEPMQPDGTSVASNLDSELEFKLSLMDSDKATKVRAALAERGE